MESWNCLLRWLERNAPDMVRGLQAPASVHMIARLEERLVLKLPAGLRAMYLSHDGQILEASPDGLFHPYWFGSLETVDAWAWALRQRLAGSPCADRSFRLIPFAADHQGDMLCLDADDVNSPVFLAQAGAYGVEQLTPHLDSYLQSWLDGLEKGLVHYYDPSDEPTAAEAAPLVCTIGASSSGLAIAGLVGAVIAFWQSSPFAAGFAAFAGLTFARLALGTYLLNRILSGWERQVADARDRFPNEPWNAVEEWRQGRGAPLNQHNPSVTLVFQVLWFTAAVGMLWSSPGAGGWSWFVSVPAAVWSGLSLLWVASGMWIYLRKGRPELRLDHVPAQMGGMLRARFRRPEPFDARIAVTAWLECVLRRQDGCQVIEEVVARENATVTLSADRDTAIVEVCPPPNGRATRVTAHGLDAKWLLHLQVGFERWTFAVPVWSAGSIRKARLSSAA